MEKYKSKLLNEKIRYLSSVGVIVAGSSMFDKDELGKHCLKKLNSVFFNP